MISYLGTGTLSQEVCRDIILAYLLRKRQTKGAILVVYATLPLVRQYFVRIVDFFELNQQHIMVYTLRVLHTLINMYFNIIENRA